MAVLHAHNHNKCIVLSTLQSRQHTLGDVIKRSGFFLFQNPLPSSFLQELRKPASAIHELDYTLILLDVFLALSSSHLCVIYNDLSRHTSTIR